MRKFISFLIGVFVIIIIVFAIRAFNSRDFVREFVPIRQEEAVTELYFENHTKLPKVGKTGEKQTFVFTVQNNSRAQVNYLYQVILSVNDENRILDTKKISVLSNDKKSISESYIIDSPTSNAKITVAIPYTNEYISYRFIAE